MDGFTLFSQDCLEFTIKKILFRSLLGGRHLHNSIKRDPCVLRATGRTQRQFSGDPQGSPTNEVTCTEYFKNVSLIIRPGTAPTLAFKF